MKKVLFVFMIISAILIIFSICAFLEIRSLFTEIQTLQDFITENKNSETERYLTSIEENDKAITSILSSVESLDSKIEILYKTIDSTNGSQSEICLIDKGQISNELNEVIEKQKTLEAQISSFGDYKQKIDTILAIIEGNKTTSEFVYDAPSNEQEFTYTHIRFLNALNRTPDDITLWDEYVSFILTYGNYSDFQIADENLNSALLFVPEEDFDLLFALEEKIKIAITSFDIIEPVDYNDFYEKCSKLEALFLSDEASSYQEITKEYNSLLNQYSSMEDINDTSNRYFSRLTEYYNVIDSFENMKTTANYWVASENDTYETCQLLSTLQNSLLDTKTAYSQIGISSVSVLKSKADAEEAINSLSDYARNLILEEAEKAKPNVKFMTKELAKVEYTKYEMTLERLASYIPNDSILQEKINQMILGCYAAITDISERQSKSYQIWVYNMIIDAKEKVANKDKDSFASFFSINSALITVPEIYSLYVDVLSSVKNLIKDAKYEEYVKTATIQGLKSYEDF